VRERLEGRAPARFTCNARMEAGRWRVGSIDVVSW
jgi:hypothetical protein